MRILSPDKPVKVEHDNFSMWYHPFVRYIVSDYEAMVLQSMASRTIWTHSSFNNHEKRPGGSDNLNGKRVCIYRHTAYGDQLMISSVIRYLKCVYPEVTIGYYCDPGMNDLWKDNPFVGGSALPLPIPFEVADSYDYHIFYEGMLENNGERDQRCCYDYFFSFFGHNNVPACYKVPFFQIRPEDYDFRSKLDDRWKTGRYMVYHQSPANKNRAYPFSQGADFIRMFLKNMPDWKVLIVGDRQHGKIEIDDDRVLNLVDKTNRFRLLAPLIESASLFVGPDSSMAHLCACFPQVPSVTLWGLFHPDDRVKYYPNSYPLFLGHAACPYAPCHNHDFELPKYKCCKAEGFDGEWCRGLAAITPEMIFARCMEALK